MRLPGFDLPNPTLFENSFFQGLLVLVLVLLAAIAYLLLFYFFAEAIVVTVDIAVNVRALARGASLRRYRRRTRIATRSSRTAIRNSTTAIRTSPNAAIRLSTNARDRAEMSELRKRGPAGATFCNRCGTSLLPPAT